MTSPGEILKWWIEEVGPEGWYAGGEALDAETREKFLPAYEELMTGAYGMWLTGPFSSLAYIILTDQLPRNMFRGQARAFAADGQARAAAKCAIDKGWDHKVPLPERQFFYMPLMHSENLVDQERAVRLIGERMGPDSDHLLHACAHRSVIRRFGRFPFRNEALGRATTQAEQAWLDAGGYGEEVRLLREAEDRKTA